MISNQFRCCNSQNPADIPGDSMVVSIRGDSNLIGCGIHSPDFVSNVLKDSLEKNVSAYKRCIVNASTSGYDLQKSMRDITRLFRLSSCALAYTS